MGLGVRKERNICVFSEVKSEITGSFSWRRRGVVSVAGSSTRLAEVVLSNGRYCSFDSESAHF